MATLCIEEMKAHYLQISSKKNLNEGEFIAIGFSRNSLPTSSVRNSPAECSTKT
jgi:hypothetical protein